MASKERRLTRRGFVRITTHGALLAGLGLPGVLAACAPTPISPAASGASTNAVSASGAPAGKINLPTYIPFAGPQPDLAGTADGLDPAYFAYPANLVRSVKSTPGHGGDVTAFISITQQAPPPVEQNAAWQAVNKELGVSMRLNMVSNTDYLAKFGALVAGNDLPDFIYYGGSTLPGMALPEFLKAKCADLSPYLSGDAVKDYPNLANIPPLSWRSTVWNNAIYALPLPRPPFSYILLIRQEVLDAAGLQQPTNADELKRILETVTRPQDDQFGFGTTPDTYALGMLTGGPFLGMFGAPNNWDLGTDGKLVKDFETDHFKAALGYLRDLWSAGVFHPNSMTYTSTALDLDVRSGKRVVMEIIPFTGVLQGWDAAFAANPQTKLRVMAPIAADGGKARLLLGPGYLARILLKQSTPDRVQMLLHIADYLAAPFGSQEYELLKYGVQNTDYTYDDKHNPTSTSVGLAEALPMPWKYVAGGAPVLYDPVNSQEYASTFHAAEESLHAVGVQDPTLGLFSATDVAMGGQLARDVYDGVVQIVNGQNPLNTVDSLVSTWRSKGGDTIRGEYEQALAAASKSSG
jgi:putative aldouronate transport system substrate-binding protein